MASERLQKFVARAGLGSRRGVERWIVAGRVAVNGTIVTELGTRVDPAADRVTVDGVLVSVEGQQRVVVALNKPRGVITSLRDRHADRLVVDLLDGIEERVYPMGRLDRDSEGLVLLTNDGDLMNAVTRPGGGAAKRYSVTVRGKPTVATLQRLESGVELGGRQLLPCQIRRRGEDDAATTLEVTLHEGKKNQIRRLFAAAGYPVLRLIREAVGPVELGGLASGEFRRLEEREIEALGAAARTSEAAETARGEST